MKAESATRFEENAAEFVHGVPEQAVAKARESQAHTSAYGETTGSFAKQSN